MTDQAKARRMLTLDEVLRLVPFSRSTLFRMERSGIFPPSYWPSPGRRVWFEDDVIAWQNALPPNNRINPRQVVSSYPRHIKAVD